MIAMARFKIGNVVLQLCHFGFKVLKLQKRLAPVPMKAAFLY
jgi:hypothetical protein